MGYSKNVFLDGGPLHGHHYFTDHHSDRIEIDLLRNFSADMKISDLATNQKAYYRRTTKINPDGAEVYTWIDLNITENESNKEGTDTDKV